MARKRVRLPKGANEIRTPISGTVWRIGNPDRDSIKVGDIIHKDEEIANIETMKMESAILAPFNARIKEICIKLNESVQEGQLLFVLEPV